MRERVNILDKLRSNSKIQLAAYNRSVKMIESYLSNTIVKLKSVFENI
jgi:hypothetical protein